MLATGGELAALRKIYDVNDDGFVSFAEFSARVSGCQAKLNPSLADEPPIVPPSAAEGARGAAAVWAAWVLFTTGTARIGAQQLLAGWASAKWRSLTQTFLQLDRDRSGFIEKSEFARALRRAGLELSQADLDLLVEMYDQDKDGRIGISELSRMLAGSSSGGDSATALPSTPHRCASSAASSSCSSASTPRSEYRDQYV